MSDSIKVVHFKFTEYEESIHKYKAVELEEVSLEDPFHIFVDIDNIFRFKPKAFPTPAGATLGIFVKQNDIGQIEKENELMIQENGGEYIVLIQGKSINKKATSIVKKIIEPRGLGCPSIKHDFLLFLI